MPPSLPRPNRRRRLTTKSNQPTTPGGSGRRRRHHRRRRRFLLFAAERARRGNARAGNALGTGCGCRCPNGVRPLARAPGVGCCRGEFGSRTGNALSAASTEPCRTRWRDRCARGSRRRGGPRDAGSGAGRSLGRNRQRLLRPPGHAADQRARRAAGYLRDAAPVGWVERPGAGRLALAGIRHCRAQSGDAVGQRRS